VRSTWNFDPLNPTAALRPATTQSFVDSNNKELWVSSAQMRQLVEAISTTSPGFLNGAGLTGFPASWVTPSYAAALPFFDTSKLTHDLVRQSIGSDGNSYPQIPAYSVEERIRAAYLRLDYDSDVFGHAIEGNIGLRYAGTRTVSVGRQRLLLRVERSPGSAAYDDIQVANALVTKENSYHDFLPSLNAATWLSPDMLLLRLGYGKVMARPSLDRLTPNFTCVINSGKAQFGGDGVDDCTGGNPDLRPYRAINKDLSLEWYPSRGSQLSLAYFRKDITNSIQNNVAVRKDLLGDGKVFDITTTINYAGATTKGIELAGQTAFTFLPGLLSGFGAGANYTRMSFDYARGGELLNPLDGSLLPFPGMSRTAYNLAIWYDKARINARLAYNHRDGYYTGSNDTFTSNPLFAEPTGFLDAKIQYRIDKHFSLSHEAKNLSNQSTLTTAGDITRPNEYSWSGRRYYLSLGYTN
jgi:TonB-dependent receptor